MQKQYTETELARLIETVETEFNSYLAKSEAVESAAPLAKAEDAPSKDEKKSDKKDEKSEDKKEEKEAPKAEKEPEHKEEASEEAAPKEDGKAEEKEAPSAQAEEDHGYDEEDLEHMHKMYSSMSKGELKAHHDAIMKCGNMMQMSEPAMAKSESTEIKIETQPTKEATLLKSELEATKAQNEELKKNMEGLKEFLTALVKKVPQGKAVTSLDVIAKGEDFHEKKELSKPEITKILTQKASDPTLQKSDREAINSYYATGQINVNQISHLLK